MGEHEQRKPADAETPQLVVDVRLRRPLIDEHGALPDLEEDRITLAHVEHGDAKTAGRRRRTGRLKLPARDEGGAEARRGDEPTAASGGQARGRPREQSDDRGGGEHELGAHLRAG